jgi:signal transduction histidine kinase
MANLFAAQSGAYIAYRHIVEEGLRTAGLAALGQMAATVAHELRNPLGSIKGAAQFLEAQAKAGKATPEAIADLLGIIVEEVNGLGTLTTNLLEFARPAPLMCADIDLAEVVESEVAFLREELTRIGVLDLQVNVMRPARIWGDAAQLSRVLRNLLLNAAQAVASVANSRAEGRVQLALTPLDNGWTLTLRDNGPGIPESVRHRLFEPFFTTKARGTGLGLAQVRQTIEAHGGEVRAENHDEGGAVFTLWLPDEQKETTHGNNFSGR